MVAIRCGIFHRFSILPRSNPHGVCIVRTDCSRRFLGHLLPFLPAARPDTTNKRSLVLQSFYPLYFRLKARLTLFNRSNNIRGNIHPLGLMLLACMLLFYNVVSACQHAFLKKSFFAISLWAIRVYVEPGPPRLPQVFAAQRVTFILVSNPPFWLPFSSLGLLFYHRC
jgi:hypothetical protein